MFIYLCWKNREGETKETLLPLNKATKLSEQLELLGTKTWFKQDNLTNLS